MRTLSLIVLAVLVFGGCSEQPAEPTSATNTSVPSLAAAPDAGDFMPLAPGNHWSYHRTLYTMIIPDNGPPEPPEILEEQVDIDHVDYETIDDRTYVLERESYSSEPGASERLRRQDRAGYYIFDRDKDEGKHADRPVLSTTQRTRARQIARRFGADPACIEAHFARMETARRMLRGLDTTPPGGPEADEIQTLAYPLHPGATWVIRDVPLYTGTVEERERVAGFNAWRVRVENEFLNAGDAIHIWYSRCGQTGWRFHFTSTAVAEDGTVLGTLISDDIVMLLDSRVERGGCNAVSGGGGGGGNGGVMSYPLAVGNRWTYEITTTLDAPPAPETHTTIVDEEQTEWVDIGGRTYMKQVTTQRGPSPWITVAYLREDSDGLYTLDPIIAKGLKRAAGARSQPASIIQKVRRAMAERAEGEAVLLDYPLGVGESWVIRDNYLTGRWQATVEALERIDTPAGRFTAFRVSVRIHYDIPDDNGSPSTAMLLWYGREGLVKAYARTTTTDGPVEEAWELQELDLAR